MLSVLSCNGTRCDNCVWTSSAAHPFWRWYIYMDVDTMSEFLLIVNFDSS